MYFWILWPGRWKRQIAVQLSAERQNAVQLGKLEIIACLSFQIAASERVAKKIVQHQKHKQWRMCLIISREHTRILSHFKKCISVYASDRWRWGVECQMTISCWDIDSDKTHYNAGNYTNWTQLFARRQGPTVLHTVNHTRSKRSCFSTVCQKIQLVFVDPHFDIWLHTSISRSEAAVVVFNVIFSAESNVPVLIPCRVKCSGSNFEQKTKHRM